MDMQYVEKSTWYKVLMYLKDNNKYQKIGLSDKSKVFSKIKYTIKKKYGLNDLLKLNESQYQGAMDIVDEQLAFIDIKI